MIPTQAPHLSENFLGLDLYVGVFVLEQYTGGLTTVLYIQPVSSPLLQGQ